MATRMLICEDDTPLRRMVSARLDSAGAPGDDADPRPPFAPTCELVVSDIDVADSDLEPITFPSLPEATGHRL